MSPKMSLQNVTTKSHYKSEPDQQLNCFEDKLFTMLRILYTISLLKASFLGSKTMVLSFYGIV